MYNSTETQYLTGIKNWFIRCYFYLEQGLNVLNIFRNLFLGIFAVYIALKLSNYLYMLGMFALAVPILIIVGYYSVHHIAKIKEWLGIKFSTHYAMQSFNYSKDTVELLQKIEEHLSKLNK